jgi:hypothetical protein
VSCRRLEAAAHLHTADHRAGRGDPPRRDAAG